MKPLVSVIVPIYRVEDCLKRCLNSLRRQTLTQIEIILVDDASPDNSASICNAYASVDGRFKVVHHTKNLGLSEARNTGIRHATCDFLMFVDSDDYVHEDFCKIPYECAVKTHSDLVMFGRQDIGFSKLWKIKRQSAHTEPEGYKTHLEALELMFTKVGMVAWNKLYSKELFKNVLYPSGYYYEDAGIAHKLILKASQIYYLHKVLYYRCYRAGSITTLRTKKVVHDRYTLEMQQYHDLVVWGYPIDKAESLLQNISLSYCIWNKPDISDPIYINCEKTLRDSNIIPKNMTHERKLLLFLFRYCPLLFELICTLNRKKVR